MSDTKHVKGDLPPWPAPTWAGSHAHGSPLASGRIRTQNRDFLVEEVLGFPADGEGEHWLLKVEKTDSNTAWVAGQLARIGGVSRRDVGYSGLKDRRAVTLQYFSIPLRRDGPGDWCAIKADGFRVRDAQRHRRKLRRGAHQGNRFSLLIRECNADPRELARRLQRIASDGVPNYFGEQRFGRAGGNLSLARRVFADPGHPWPRADKEFALSASRSLIFNEVLAARVRQGSWNQLLPGDVAMLSGSRSVFKVDAVDDTLLQRLAQHDLDPSGPLPGEAGLVPSGIPLQLETSVCDAFPGLGPGLAAWRVKADRRRLRLLPTDLGWELGQEGLALSFTLPSGSFATAVLRELIDYVEGQDAG